MKLYGVLVFMSVTLFTAYGLRCYTCLSSSAESCTEVTTCASPFNRCFSLSVFSVYTKGCQTSYACVPGMSCCEGDLCNGAIVTGPTVVLLLVTSAIITLFV